MCFSDFGVFFRFQAQESQRRIVDDWQSDYLEEKGQSSISDSRGRFRPNRVLNKGERCLDTGDCIILCVDFVLCAN